MEIVTRENHAISQNEHLDESVAVSIGNKLENSSSLLSECCIYKIPDRLIKVKPDDYKPRVISIGPIHFLETGLQAMEKYKLKYLQYFILRSNKSLEELEELAWKWEKTCRNYYAEKIEMSRHEFVQMIILDGSFIVELFLRYREYYSLGELHEYDPVVSKPSWLLFDVVHDLMLLENQLPFFILKGFLDELCYPESGKSLSIMERSRTFFSTALEIMELPSSIHSHNQEVMHLVDFLWQYYLPSSSRPLSPSDGKGRVAPSATDLYNARVVIKSGRGRSLLDIVFAEGVLEIPRLVINISTESKFRNLIAFEQCHCDWRHMFITQYVKFLNDLTNTPSDVELLIQYGVISHFLGSNENVVELFNRLNINVGCSRILYANECKASRAYCRKPWNKWKATLKRDYFNTPWAIISFIAACILLSLTLIQTLFAVISI